MSLRRQTAVLAGLAAAAILLAMPASAAGDADAGADVAMRWCSACHLIRPLASGPVLQGPPTFQTMARERSPTMLRTFLANPHAPMPPIELSRTDIENLLAYIEAQR
jgi:mono/diheme cytochrome c family protein